MWKTSLWHAGRDTLGQVAGKTAGLMAFSGLSQFSLAVLPLKFVAGGIGALSAGTMSYLIARHQIGSASTCQKAAALLCAAAGASAGLVVASFGSWQIVSGLALAGCITPAVSLLGSPLNRCGNPHRTAAVEAAKAGLFTVGVLAGSAGGLVISAQWSIAEEMLAARNGGAAVESLVVELCKSSFEQIGLSVNRNVLSFEGKVLASAIGTLPYVLASLYVNGFLASMVQPPQGASRFLELLAPVLLGTLANGIRGAANSAAVRVLHGRGIASLEPMGNEVRPHHGLMPPNGSIVAQKSAIRFFLIACRNAIFLSLRAKGMPLMQASTLAQLVYSFFAQNRELMFDLMQGQGWTACESAELADDDSARISEDSSASSSRVTLGSVSSSESDPDESAT